MLGANCRMHFCSLVHAVDNIVMRTLWCTTTVLQGTQKHAWIFTHHNAVQSTLCHKSQCKKLKHHRCNFHVSQPAKLFSECTHVLWRPCYIDSRFLRWPQLNGATSNYLITFKQARNLRRCALKAGKTSTRKTENLANWLIPTRKAECGKPVNL